MKWEQKTAILQKGRARAEPLENLLDDDAQRLPDLQRQLEDAKLTLKDAKWALNYEETVVRTDVLAGSDGAGPKTPAGNTPATKNEAGRKDAVTLALKQAKPYQAQEAAVRKAENEALRLEWEMSALQLESQAARYKLGILRAELLVLATGEGA